MRERQALNVAGTTPTSHRSSNTNRVKRIRGTREAKKAVWIPARVSSASDSISVVLVVAVVLVVVVVKVVCAVVVANVVEVIVLWSLVVKLVVKSFGMVGLFFGPVGPSTMLELLGS